MPLYLKRLGREETFYLSPDKEKIIIGRSPQCDISFPSLHISRQHCQILRLPPNGALIIRNVKDTNCTYVNELKLQNSDAFAELEVGCRIGLGVPLLHATGNGMHNNNFVFLELERSQSPSQTRQNERTTTENERNIQTGVQCHPGELPPVATTLDHPPEAAVHTQGAGGSFLISRESNQEFRVPLEGLQPHLISLKDNLESESTSAVRSYSPPQIGQPVSTQSGESQTSITAATLNTVERLPQNTVGSEVGSAEELKCTGQRESNTQKNSNVKSVMLVNENPLTPIQLVDSNNEPKQGFEREMSYSRKQVDGHEGEASVPENVVSEPVSVCNISPALAQPSTRQCALPIIVEDIEDPSSPMSIDLTQADPVSPISTNFAGSSSKEEENAKTINLVSLVSSDEDAFVTALPEENSLQRKDELSGKRKRLMYDVPPVGTGSAEEADGGSTKKKVKNFSFVHADNDSWSKNEPSEHRRRLSENSDKGEPNEASKNSDGDGELFLKRKTDQPTSKCDPNKAVQNNDCNSEPLLYKTNLNSDIHSNKAMADIDSDDEPLFMCKRKKVQNLSKRDSLTASVDSESESQTLVCKSRMNQNSSKCDSLRDSDRDSDPLFLKRKSNQHTNKCNLNKSAESSGSDSEPSLCKRKTDKRPNIIYSSDNDSDIGDAVAERTHARKSVESRDMYSLFTIHAQRCTVSLNRLSSHVIKSSAVALKGNSSTKADSTSASKNARKISGDGISQPSEACISYSDKCKLSQKDKDKKRRKKRPDESRTFKDGEEVVKKLTTVELHKQNKVQNKGLGDHSSHTDCKKIIKDDQREVTGASPLVESCTSVATSLSSNFVDSVESNEVVEKDKVSDEVSCKEDTKIEGTRGNVAEISTEIKTEPGLSCEKNTRINSEENDDGEKDDAFMYSQMGEEIWISSDEEKEEPPQLDRASTSLDEELDLLFAQEDEPQSSRSSASVKEQLAEVVGGDVDCIDSVDDDDQWFPVLSQSFLESSDEEDNKDEDGNKDSEDIAQNTLSTEPTPGPSGLGESLPDKESEENENEWWPILSQGFFDDEEEEEEEQKEKDETSISNNTEVQTGAREVSFRACGTIDLQSVIKKLKKKSPRTSQLTEPKIPVPSSSKRTQKGSSNRMEMNNFKTSEPSAIIKENEDVQNIQPSTIIKENDAQEIKQKQRNSRNAKHVNKKDKKKTSLDLRKTLASQYKSYKNVIECKTKGKHHLVIKDKEKSNKPPPGPPTHKSSNERTVSKENISIQKKTKVDDATTENKVRSKVAAKVTTKSRFEKLIDVDLFSKPSKSTVTSKKSKFKIPKSSGSKPNSSSVRIEAGGSGLVLDKRINREAAGSNGGTLFSGTTEPQLESGSENTIGEKQNLAATSAVIRNDSSGRIDEINKGLQKVKLKSASKRVHFPQKEEDLVKVLFISPRKKGERTGLPSVKAREVLPEELMLQRQNIPPYFMELFIHHVCHWNYDWLECYHTAQEKHRAGVLKGIPAPPPVVSSTNYPTLILYSSYSDFKETHSSLFYLELWERIYKDWVRSRNKFGLQALIECVRPAFIKTPSGTVKFWAIKLIVAVPQTQNISIQDFRQGTLISLKVRKNTKKSVIFGYIDYMMGNNRRVTSEFQNQKFAQMSHSFTLGIRVAKEIIQTVKHGTVVTISDVSYIRPCSRIWEALCKLPLSPLCSYILSPSPEVFSCEKDTKYLIKNLPLNEMQVKAVTAVSSKCMYDYSIPKMSLIHGPPGTGKTSTIVALVAQMVEMGRLLGQGSMPQCRVLICAPSNAAVDELTLRLIRLRDIGHSLRVVRVGFKTSDHPLVKNCTLDQFVNKQVRTELSAPRCESARQEWQRKKNLVHHVAEELEMARKEGRQNEIRHLEVRLNEMVRAQAEFESSFKSEPSTREKHELQQKWQQEFLLKAEVVTTTLNSCVSGVMLEVLSRHPHHFTCCIVDEAGQCQETETLLPLLLGVRKFVLVGDHHQLPATVLSQLALTKNLKQSLFERLHHRLVLELQRDDLVHTLTVQYRMHPEIVEWPASHFYHSQLITSPSLVVQANFSLKPYMIFDLKTSQEQRHVSQEMYNPAEASLVCVLLSALESHLYHKTVGIITPYQRQRIYLEEKLAKFKGIINLSVNTIDGFQGQERDVIILSFVRANNSANIGFLSHRQRLNVALTRAKKVCYIIASLSSLEGNKEWNSLIRNGRQRGLVCTVTSKEENDKIFLRSVVENEHSL